MVVGVVWCSMVGQLPCNVGDTVQMDYSGRGYDPVFTVEEIKDEGYMAVLNNGGRIFPKDFESGRFEIID